MTQIPTWLLKYGCYEHNADIPPKYDLLYIK